MNCAELQHLIDKNEDLALVCLDANVLVDSLYQSIKRAFSDAGVDPFIFNSMRIDLLRGNFAVLYLDDRLVMDTKRAKLQKSLEKQRGQLYAELKRGKTPLEILFR